MRSLVVFLMTLMLSISSAAEDHALYEQYLDIIQLGPESITVSEVKDKKLFVDALWDTVVGLEQKSAARYATVNDPENWSLAEQLRLTLIASWPEPAVIDEPLKKRIQAAAQRKQLTDRDAMTLFVYAEFFENDKNLVALVSGKKPSIYQSFQKVQKSFRTKTKEEIQDLFFNSPDLKDYKNGHYAEGVRLFMFCRYNRPYKCVLLMKDKDNKPVKNADGSLWYHPALGMSRKFLPSHVRNGNTPEGVHTIDSVMPEANKQRIYGKYRRLIMNFVPKSPDEQKTKAFLPESAKDKNWWRSAVVARDVGRNFLRIHGTGVKKSRPSDPNHPMRPTLGCVMQRELKFGSTTYKDQRKLLDKMMVAQGLKPEYKNETQLKGVIYLIELDKQKTAVTIEEIQGLLDI